MGHFPKWILEGGECSGPYGSLIYEGTFREQGARKGEFRNMCPYKVGTLYENGLVIHDGKFKMKEGQVKFSEG